ncbi:hypothetical protein THAOC_27232, partial [Thalassiosira oceanica]
DSARSAAATPSDMLRCVWKHVVDGHTRWRLLLIRSQDDGHGSLNVSAELKPKKLVDFAYGPWIPAPADDRYCKGLRMGVVRAVQFVGVELLRPSRTSRPHWDQKRDSIAIFLSRLESLVVGRFPARPAHRLLENSISRPEASAEASASAACGYPSFWDKKRGTASVTA